jgi:beta-galactosidase
MKSAAKWMMDISGVKPALGIVPDGIEVYPRYGSKGTVYILVNLSKASSRFLFRHRRRTF